ncbi:MAG: site-specific integrase [Gemmatimonadetes bacterium]|nr:site-specific integrase [Gemmatimonadota bacterium]
MKHTRGMGRVYQRGEKFWIQYSHHGRKIRESSESPKESVARALLKRRLGESGTGRPVGPEIARTTFEVLAAMLLADYALNALRSGARVKAALAHLRGFFTFARVPDITSDRIAAYIQQRLAEEAAAATIHYELACLRRAFNLAVRAGKAAGVPYIPAIALDNARKGFFEPADFEAVLKALPEPLRPFMRFLYLTGWRAGEARGLTWAGVDFTANVVRLEPGVTKNRAGREFPFAAFPALAELLREQRERTSALEREQCRIIAPVFHRHGKPIVSYVRAWAAACKATGLEGRLVHDLRRTAVRNLERAGVSRSVAMKLTGHKTEAVYSRYAITSAADLSEGVAKLATLHSGAPGSRSVLPFQSSGTERAQSGV